MSSSRPATQFAGALMGIALCISSTAAGAAATPASPVAPISPLVALSAFASPLSASAVRSTLSQSSAASLPMTAAVVQGASDTDDDDGPRGIGLLGVLAGLALFLGITALILGGGDDDGEINLPPVSPD